MNSTVRTTFIQAVTDKLAEADTMFGTELANNTSIEINIRGYRTAGQARTKRGYAGWEHRIRFHPVAVAKHLHEMIHDVIPHEVAHLVCHEKPILGSNHNRGWQAVCLALGGNGKRCHDMAFSDELKAKHSRKRTVYQYRGSLGTIIDMGAIRHKKCQNGVAYAARTPKGKETITADGYIGVLR